MNGTLVKNQLIFEFAAGSLGLSKSLFTATYLYLNSKASKINDTFETILSENLLKSDGVPLSNLKYLDCMNKSETISTKERSSNPITAIVGPYNDLDWKQVYKGFREYSPNIKDKDELKLIKMDPGASVPLHSHDGKEFILVLEGSFCDEYGEYKTGDIQINDQKIKHNPIANKDTGCICLTITEKDVIFFGRFGSFLNLFTFIRSFFK
tara:strand:+ start:5249 stop:5875 length:627 start_codon:yes stop_codon:yes gene_type:complete